MSIYSLTPEYDIVSLANPNDRLDIVDNRFVGHIGDLPSLLHRMDVMFHDSPINIKNSVFEYRLEEIVVRTVPGNHERVCQDIIQALDHLEFLRSGFQLPYAEVLGLSNLHHELKEVRSALTREIIFEECPQRMRSNQWRAGIKVVLDQLAAVMARYLSMEVVKTHPWKEEDQTELEHIRIQQAGQFKTSTEIRHKGLDDLLLPKYMEEAPPKPEFPRDEVRLDLSAFGMTSEQLTELAEKAKAFGADYHTYGKGVVLTYIPFREEFEEGVPDE